MKLIRLATVAPEGSAWMETMHAIDKEVRAQSGGEVGFKFYPNMSMGDEKDIIRKIRLGQINGAGFTGFGLGEILPEIRILELPYLFHNDQEIDYTVECLTDTFRQHFADKGFIMLGWADVGWIYFMSRKPVASPKDLTGLKVWMWEGDPLAKAFFTELKKTPVNLSVADVLMSLQTGMIDAVYGSPLTTLVLQWFTKLQYVSDVPFTNAVGAVLLDKATFDALTPDQQRILLEISAVKLKELKQRSRQDNRDAYTRLIKEGLKPVESTEADQAEMRGIGLRVQERMVGKLYSQEMLDNLRSIVKKADITTKPATK
jgi:TRAP-type C4-dicarboxylate transport system substrate-binding protein